MTDLDRAELRQLAESALPDGPLGAYTFAGTGKLRSFQSGFGPKDALALLDALDEAERERDELGKAAFAAILAAGEDTDGARSWADYFRPLKFPAWDVAVQRAVTRLREDLAQSDDEAEAAEAALARVRALHRVDQGTEGRAIVRCVCEERWPCSTIQALDGAPEPEEKP